MSRTDRDDELDLPRRTATDDLLDDLAFEEFVAELAEVEKFLPRDDEDLEPIRPALALVH